MVRVSGQVSRSVAPVRSIAGGFLLVPVASIMDAWRACCCRPLGVADFRAWLALREMVARRRRRLDDGRAPVYSAAEVARLLDITPKRTAASLRRLVAAGLVDWSESAIAFPGDRLDDDPQVADTIGRGRGDLAIPRRLLRFLAGGARPALIATALGTLLRCLSRRRPGFDGRGRVKAGWIERAFGIDLRRVKAARAELVANGWIEPLPLDQWAANRWGRAYRIDLAWAPPTQRCTPPATRCPTPAPGGASLPPPPPESGASLPPPSLDQDPLAGEEKNQNPASGGPAGVEVHRPGEGETPRAEPTVATPPPAVATPSPATPGLLPAATPPPAVATPPPATPGLLPAVATPSPATPGLLPAATPKPAVATPKPATPGPLPAPRLDDVRPEDLRDVGRTLALLEEAVERKLVGPSEADRLRFLSAAEHARAVGTVNPAGLFVRLVRSKLWGHLTLADEDAASAKLRRHLFGEPPVALPPPRCGPMRPALSDDALMVRRVRAAMTQARSRIDPFPLVRGKDPSWTRERWDRALAELNGAQPGGPFR